MPRGVPRQKHSTRNLIFLRHTNGGLRIFRKAPDDVQLDLIAGTWKYVSSMDKSGPHKIGDSRYCHPSCRFGTIAVFDQKLFNHIESLVSNVQHEESRNMHSDFD